MKVYELQKEINDFDYKASQASAQMKKKHDDEIMELKNAQEEEFQQKYTDMEEKRND